MKLSTSYHGFVIQIFCTDCLRWVQIFVILGTYDNDFVLLGAVRIQKRKLDTLHGVAFCWQVLRTAPT